MKKIIYLLLIGILLSSCSEDNTTNSFNDLNPEERIIGKWCSSYGVGDSTISVFYKNHQAKLYKIGTNIEYHYLWILTDEDSLFIAKYNYRGEKDYNSVKKINFVNKDSLEIPGYLLGGDYKRLNY